MMDYYNTLGVPRDADQDTIKKAFRKLAMQHHPDKGGDPDQFQKITEAYETLSDADKRFQYDNPRVQTQGFMGDFTVAGVDINDIFSQIFGHHPFQHHRQQKQIFRTQVYVSLVDAYHGNNQVMQLNTHMGSKAINISVPKGIHSGEQVRYDNVIDGASLIAQFIVEKDLKFDRNGDDLYSNIPISVLDLITGTKLEITTLTGKKLEVNIKPKTQPTDQIRIQGYGMPIKDTGFYGDQILLLKPYVPATISQDVIDSIIRNQSK